MSDTSTLRQFLLSLGGAIALGAVCVAAALAPARASAAETAPRCAPLY